MRKKKLGHKEQDFKYNEEKETEYQFINVIGTYTGRGYDDDHYWSRIWRTRTGILYREIE